MEFPMLTFRQYLNEKKYDETRNATKNHSAQSEFRKKLQETIDWHRAKDAVKTGVKKDWKKKVALALAPGPFTPIALAMTYKDIRNAYRASAISEMTGKGALKHWLVRNEVGNRISRKISAEEEDKFEPNKKLVSRLKKLKTRLENR